MLMLADLLAGGQNCVMPAIMRLVPAMGGESVIVEQMRADEKELEDSVTEGMAAIIDAGGESKLLARLNALRVRGLTAIADSVENRLSQIKARKE